MSATGRLALFVDLHGHSIRDGAFFYGCDAAGPLGAGKGLGRGEGGEAGGGPGVGCDAKDSDEDEDEDGGGGATGTGSGGGEGGQQRGVLEGMQGCWRYWQRLAIRKAKGLGFFTPFHQHIS